MYIFKIKFFIVKMVKMVNQELLNDIKSKLAESSSSTVEDITNLFEVYKQVSSELKELREEFEDMAMLEMEFLGQIIVSNKSKKYWLKFKDGKIDYGEGDVEYPSLTFKTTMATLIGILFGQIEISSAHEAGDVSFDGGSEVLMDFQAITSVINEFIQNI